MIWDSISRVAWRTLSRSDTFVAVLGRKPSFWRFSLPDKSDIVLLLLAHNPNAAGGACAIFRPRCKPLALMGIPLRKLRSFAQSAKFCRAVQRFVRRRHQAVA